MVYSVKLQKEIPVQISKKYYQLIDGTPFVQYYVKDGKIPVGHVDLADTRNGVEVLYIKSMYPDLYKHFGQVADQIEVEHCLERGIDQPIIKSVAALGSHIAHYKRGKRFINEGVNVFLQDLISKLEKGQRELTGFLGNQPMYMPQNLINEIKEKIKINRLLTSDIFKK